MVTAVVVTATALLVPGAAAEAAPAAPASCSSQVVAWADADSALAATNCDYSGVIVSFPDGLGVTVPNVGDSVALSGIAVEPNHIDTRYVANLGAKGVAVALVGSGSSGIEVRGAAAAVSEVESKRDARPGSTISPDSVPDPIPSACLDSRWYRLPSLWNVTYSWRYNSTNEGAPSALARTRDGVGTIAAGTTRCGATYANSATQSYLGTTSLSPNINLNGNCTTSDGTNTIGWGALPTSNGTLALTCTWYTPETGLTAEADTKFNKAYSWFSGATVSDCSGSKYDVGAVATHEAGHIFGLDHVYDSYLTMKPAVSYCETAGRKLGYGDAIGLQALYP